MLYLAQAKELAVSTKEATNQLGKVASVLARVGQKDEAIALLAEITKQTKPSTNPFEIVSEEIESAWRHIAEALANDQEWGKAIAVAHSMKNSWEKIHTMRSIASRLAKAKKREWASELLAEAVTVAHAIDQHYSDADDDRFSYRMMGIILSAFGVSSDGIDNTETYVIVLSELAAEIGTLGERDRAMAVLAEAVAEARKIKHIRNIHVLAAATIALIQIGEKKLASELFNELKELTRLGTRDTEKEDERSLSKNARTINSEINALCKMAYTLAKLEHDEEAERMLIETKELARSDLLSTNNLRIRDVRDLALFAVASASSGIKLWDIAVEAVHLMNCIATSTNFDAVSMVAERLGEGRQSERARTLVKTIKVLNDGDRIKALCRVARALANVGEKSGAILALIDAEMLVRSLDENWSNGEIVREWVKTWAEVGEWEKAKALARNLKEDGDKATSLSEIASILVKKGEKRTARSLLEEAEQMFLRIKERGQYLDQEAEALAKAMAEMGMWVKALEVAETITAEIREAKPNTLNYIGVAMVRTGEWNRAQVLAKSIKSIEYRNQAYSEIAIAFSEVGALDEAISMARAVEGNDDKVIALSRVATRLNRVKDKAKALQLLSEAEDLSNIAEKGSYEGIRISSASTMELSIALAEIGVWDRALAIVPLIKDGNEKAQALGDICLYLGRAGERIRELQLLQSSWLHADKRNTLIQLLIMAIPIMMLNRKTIWEYYYAVEWVDHFLERI